MPHAPLSPRLPFTGIDEVVAALRERGGRLSAPRRAVLELLFAADGPVSAEHLATAITERGDDHELSSVYRALEYLERLGVVRHVHLGHGPGLFALIGGGEREYLACERCDRVTSVDPAMLDPIREQIREGFGYQARFSHFPIIGLCDLCAAEAHGTTRGGHAMSHHEHPHDEHERPHTHQHSHGSVTHAHPHDKHDHEHVEHEHEHSHGDLVHAHPHVHQDGLEHAHDHEH
jgi:Fur family ferric uptake transcriptional regulator